MNTKFILAWATLSAVLCMTMAAAAAEKFEILEIRTVKVGDNLIGITPDRRVVGIICTTGLSKFTRNPAVVFPTSKGDLDLSGDQDQTRIGNPERPQYRNLTPAAANELCAIQTGDFKLAIYRDRADLAAKGEATAVRTFDDLLRDL